MSATLTSTEIISKVTTIEITNVQATSLDVSFSTLPGNQPNTFGNQVVLWEASGNEIPFGAPPQSVYAVPTNVPSGTFTFPDLDVNNNNYIVGYAVGPELNDPAQKYGNICSSSFIPAAGQPDPGNNFQGEISAVRPGTTNVAFDLSNFPNGLEMASNGAWAAIWQSAAPSYYNRPLQAVPLSNNQGGSFNMSIGRGLTYTIAIFTSGYNASGNSNQEVMACSATFTN